MNRKIRRQRLKTNTPPAKLARYYETLDLAEQALNNSGESAKKILTEALSSRELKHLVDGNEVIRTLSTTDTKAILDALVFYDNKNIQS